MLGRVTGLCCAASQQRRVGLAANLDACEFDVLLAFKSKQLESWRRSLMVVDFRDTAHVVKAAQICDKAVFTVGLWSDVSCPACVIGANSMCSPM